MTPRNFFYLMLAFSAIIYVPYIGAYINEHGDLTDYFKFPPIYKPTGKSPFNIIVVISIGITVLIILLLYIFPRLFGFSKGMPFVITHTKAGLPIWFWVGLVAWGGTLTVLTLELEEPKWLINWALVPLFWGFTLMLDGLVYYFNNGKSMLKDSPTELFAMALVSISGWLVFEYYNFFVNINWYYPAAGKVGHDEFLLYSVIGSSAFIPMSYEWYQLLRKVKVLNEKYKYGPRLRFPNWLCVILLLVCVAALFITPLVEDICFYMIWLAPMFLLAIVLKLLKIWTPFTAIGQSGDWTALLLFGLTFFIQGFLLEWWNRLSVSYMNGNPDNFHTNNPAYWKYAIPYVDKARIFEMPFLGFFGYLFFSIHCWLWWIGLSKLMGVDTKFSLQTDFR